MTTITDKKQYPGEQYLNELITNIEFAARAPVEVVRAMAAELQERRKADSVSVEINDDMAYAFHHALSDSSLGADEVEEIKAGLRAAFANVTTQPAPVVPEFETWFNSQESGRSICSTQIRRSLQEISWNACCAAMLQCAEPASNHEELPLDYLQGQKDGLEWAAQLAEANHPQTGDWLYDDPVELAKAIRKGPDMPEAAGNSPVIPDGLSTVCAEAYQVVGVMADALGVFGDAAVQKVLDNLSQQKLVHRDVLPFSLPVTPDGWISCSERMPDTKTAVLVAVEFDRKGDWRMKWATYIPGHPDANDGWIIPGASWKPSHWMPLPEPPQEVK